VESQLDGIVSRIDGDDIERAALESQVDRHEKWIRKASPKLSVKYSET
jgi:hypothetical protein